jgi:AcrR family transcriptional regulator
VNGVSLREIGAEAGQRNTGAVRYHFGSKAGLVDAIFRYRMEPINRRRLSMLGRLDAEGRGKEMRGLAEAFLYPLSEALGDPGSPSWYLRFSAQGASVEGTAPTVLGRDPWTEGMHAIAERFDALLAGDGFPTPLRSERWQRFAAHITQSLALRERQVQYGPRRSLTDRQLFLSDVLDTAVAVATAPVSPQTRMLLEQLDRRRPA